MGAFQTSDETELEPPLVNGASGKRCDIDRKPEQVSIGSMRIKASFAFTSTFSRAGQRLAGAPG